MNYSHGMLHGRLVDFNEDGEMEDLARVGGLEILRANF